VLIALNIDKELIPCNEIMLKKLPARKRNYETKSLYEYLKSRAIAGTTHVDLIEGMQKLMD
jgi:hypothetical protein